MVVKDFECEVKTPNERKVDVKVVASIIGFQPKGQFAHPEEGQGEYFLNYGNNSAITHRKKLPCIIPTYKNW